MDLDMPVLDGIEATRRILAERPEDGGARADVVLRPPRIIGALEAGRVRLPAQGRRRRPSRRRASAPRRAASRRSTRARRARCSTRAPSPIRSPGSPPREREVLGLLVEGLPNKLIARRLEISEKTVKSHLTQRLPRDRRDRPHAGGAVGGAPRPRRLSATKVPLRSPTGGPARCSFAMRARLRTHRRHLPCCSPSPLPRGALAHGGDDQDVRVAGSCGSGARRSSGSGRATARSRVEFEVDADRGGERWRVVLVHERRVVWRGRARTRSGAARSASGARSPTSGAPTRSRPAPPARAATRARPARCWQAPRRLAAGRSRAPAGRRGGNQAVIPGLPPRSRRAPPGRRATARRSRAVAKSSGCRAPRRRSASPGNLVTSGGGHDRPILPCGMG